MWLVPNPPALAWEFVPFAGELWMSTGHYTHMHVCAHTVQVLIKSDCMLFIPAEPRLWVNDKVALHLPLNTITN